MSKRKAARARRSGDDHSGVERPRRRSAAGWRRLIPRSIVEGVIVTLLATMIIGAGGILTRNVLRKEAPLRAEVTPFAIYHGTLPSPTAVVPVPRQELTRPPAIAGEGAQRFRVWARDLGGADAEQTAISFVLRSDLATPVVVADIRVIIRRCDPAMRGLWLQPVQGGDLPVRVMEVDLDASPPAIKRTASEGQPAWTFPLQVSQTDPELVTVVARADAHFCLWTLEVDYLHDGRTRTLTVDDAGQPFRTTGLRNITGRLRVPQTDTEPWP